MFRLDHKIALVTGGGSGIGKAITVLFAQQGAQVYLLDVDEKGANDTIEVVESQGGKALFKKCNVALAEEVQITVQSVIEEKVSIDVVVNNAGIAHIGNAEKTTPEDMERLLSVNVKGVYHLLHAALSYMKDKGGVILNLASVATSVGLADRFAYSMTKGAVASMTLSVSKDYLPYKIRCNSISSGRVHTPFYRKNIREKNRKCLRKYRKHSPLGEWADPTKLLVQPFISAPTKPAL